ncbi:hypothetical protein [Actinomadura luteofluorescens]|uniref:hypothetical protein n=1 Tax=Actinomadura luteofluorescens TaxID=46163 RepID=UPI0030CBAF55
MVNKEACRLGREAARRLARRGGIEFAPGLTEAEFEEIEQTYGFEFADDHRAFLAEGLPLSGPSWPGRSGKTPWPNWRKGVPAELRKQLEWPVEGALFDVERNGLWYSAWGQRPSDPAVAVDVARSHLERAPKLVPVRGHRYLPAGRGAFGHPVLSIVQTDIVFYGTDIADYITNEFDGGHISADWTPPPLVTFWSDFL